MYFIGLHSSSYFGAGFWSPLLTLTGCVHETGDSWLSRAVLPYFDSAFLKSEMGWIRFYRYSAYSCFHNDNGAKGLWDWSRHVYSPIAIFRQLSFKGHLRSAISLLRLFRRTWHVIYDKLFLQPFHNCNITMKKILLIYALILIGKTDSILIWLQIRSNHMRWNSSRRRFKCTPNLPFDIRNKCCFIGPAISCKNYNVPMGRKYTHSIQLQSRRFQHWCRLFLWECPRMLE